MAHPPSRSARLYLLPAIAAWTGMLLAAENTGPLPRPGELERAFATDEKSPWSFEPGSAGAARNVKTSPAAAWDFTKLKSLSVKARNLSGTRRAVRLRWRLLSHAGGLYEAVRPAPVSAAGQATEVVLDLRSGSGQLAPVGHQRPWDELAAAEVLSLELHAEVTGGGDAPVKVDLKEPKLVPAEAVRASEAQVVDVSLEAPPPDCDAAAALTFRIVPLPDDPFSSDGEADVRVRTGTGKETEALAFLDQTFFPVVEGASTRWAPSGEPRYRTFLPKLPADGMLTISSGSRSWTISIEDLRDAGMESAAAAPKLVAVPRWSAPLEVPLGQSREPLSTGLWASAPSAWKLTTAGRDPWTVSPPVATGNAWRPVSFWNAQWGNYGGERRPDLALAMRLDGLLADAAASRRSEPLVVLDGEGFSRQGVFNWASHPLNVTQGGNLSGPGELMRNPHGVEFCRRAARYAVARWGRSRAVSSFLIDVDLNAPGAADLHALLAAAMRDWPGLGGAPGAKPVYSLHPLACEPIPVADIGEFERGIRAASGAWYAGDPQPARVKAVSFDNTPAIEASALDRAASICAIKPYNMAVVDYRARPPDDFGSADALLFDVWLPADAPADLRAGVHLRDRDRLWYQALLPGLLRPGDWTTCLVDLRESNAQGLKAVAHEKPWTAYSRSRIAEIGLHVYTTHPERVLSARFARVRAVRFDRLGAPPARKIELAGAPPREIRKGEKWECHLKINRTYPNPFDAQQADLCAIVTAPSGKTLRVPGFFDQPCRRREEKPGGAEIVEPVGEERWTIRFRATEQGPHKVAIELREGGKYALASKKWIADHRFSNEGEPFAPAIDGPEDWVYGYEQSAFDGRRVLENVKFEPGPVAAALDLGVAFTSGPAAPEWHGFVRADRGGRYLRFDDGSFFYPIGPCLRSPSDNRLPYDDPKWSEQEIERIGRRGTYQYDDYFAAFEKAGINWARVWLCSWWGGLQWRRDWPGYGGYMRYNLLNAWRMDHVLDDAERRGIRINLCLINHGQVSYVIDTEWKHNPVNAELGGPIKSPSEFFTRFEAKAQHMNMLRYAAARFGHSPAVLTWALFSELEFTDEYRPSLQRIDKGMPDRPAPNIESWHVEMANYLKSVDPWQHLVSSHFSHPVRGAGVFNLPQVEIAMSNAYSAFDELAWGKMDATNALSDYWNGSEFGGGVFQGMRVYKKPVLVEEQGRHWMGVEFQHGRKIVHNSRDQLDADLHAGLWGSLMQPIAGATGYWWWLHLHFDNRYAEYKGLAEFLKGEDLRPAEGEKTLEPDFPALDPAGRMLLARALRSDRRAYAWVYHRLVPLQAGPFPEVAGERMTISGLGAGNYAIEFWDTRAGKAVGSAAGRVEDGGRRGATGALTILLPPVKGDLAIKIKPKDGGEGR